MSKKLVKVTGAFLALLLFCSMAFALKIWDKSAVGNVATQEYIVPVSNSSVQNNSAPHNAPDELYTGKYGQGDGGVDTTKEG